METVARVCQEAAGEAKTTPGISVSGGHGVVIVA